MYLNIVWSWQNIWEDVYILGKLFITKNHIKDDNRIENLEVLTDIGHKQLTLLLDKINELEQKILNLTTENEKLKSVKGNI